MQEACAGGMYRRRVSCACICLESSQWAVSPYRIAGKFLGIQFCDFAEKQAFRSLNFTICV